MLESQKIQLRQSEIRERLGVIAAMNGDAYNAEIQNEEKSLQSEYSQAEIRFRSAIISEENDLESRKLETGAPDAEMRERIELRNKARLSNFLIARAQGRMLSGPEAELCAAAGVQGIPIELWDTPKREVRSAEERAITPAPGTVGVNLDPIYPAVFANSIAPMLGIEMPRVGSGTYASATISTSVTAGARAKSADAPATRGAMTVTTATPKRVSARLELTLEDIAAIGAENFESALRDNLSLALSDELDDQAINGNGNAPNLTGIFQRLGDPSDPAANVETWERFLAIQAGGVDGLWASTLAEIQLVVNPETYRLAATTFQGTDAEESALSYMSRMGAGFSTNKRMSDKANHIAQGILYRKGRTIRTAVCPHWGEVSIDDVYSGSIKGERYFTMHVLLGDVILVQPDAYAQVAFRVSS